MCLYLPRDIWNNILKFLDDVRDIAIASMVNRELSTIIYACDLGYQLRLTNHLHFVWNLAKLHTQYSGTNHEISICDNENVLFLRIDDNNIQILNENYRDIYDNLVNDEWYFDTFEKIICENNFTKIMDYVINWFRNRNIKNIEIKYLNAGSTSLRQIRHHT